MEYQIGLATEFSEKEIKSFKKIVLKAKQVRKETFDNLIANNPLLLFAPNTAKIEAVGALKIPNNAYRNRIFEDSRAGSNPTEFEFELGWIVSLKEGNGLGSYVTRVLSNYKGNIYATVREQNEQMQHILQKYGFKQDGERFESSIGNYYNVLLIKYGK